MAIPTGFKYDVYYPFFQNNHYFWAGYTPALPVGQAPSLVGPGQRRFAVAVGHGVWLQRRIRRQLLVASSYSLTQQTVVADLENQMVSALNRGVAQLTGYAADPTDTWLDTSKYYGANSTGTGLERICSVPARDRRERPWAELRICLRR